MKIDDMHAFVAVIRCRSTNLAAEALQLTQPAITRRVQNFEEDLGDPEGIASQSIARMPLRVVAAKGSAGKRSYKLRDCYTRGWDLTPMAAAGCSIRAIWATCRSQWSCLVKLPGKAFRRKRPVNDKIA